MPDTLETPTIDFTAALERFRQLLAECGWPPHTVFLAESDVLMAPPDDAYLFRPPLFAVKGAGQNAFSQAQRKGVPAEILGIGHSLGVTYGYVRVIDDLAQGEGMFLNEGVKVALCSSPPRIHFVRSKVMWRVLQWTVARRLKNFEKALRGAA